MAERTTWITASSDRGYDHPIDEMRLADDLVSRVYQPATAPLFSPEQRRRTIEQLSLIGDDELALRTMARVALNSRDDRLKWEEANLSAAGMLPRFASKAMGDYAELAGQPTRVDEFIHWVGMLADTNVSGPLGKIIVDHSGKVLGSNEELMGQVKGKTFAIGAALQNGVQEMSNELDEGMNDGLEGLRRRYGYRVRRYAADQIARRHKIELITDLNEEGRSSQDVTSLYIIRERPFADVVCEPFKMLHVIKRSEAIIALKGLGIELERAIIKSLVQNRGEIGVAGGRPEIVKRFMQRYENAIHHGTTVADDQIAVSPVAMTHLVRNPTKK